jgi:hypothetical protein
MRDWALASLVLSELISFSRAASWSAFPEDFPVGAWPQPVVSAIEATSAPVAIVGRNAIVFIVFSGSKTIRINISNTPLLLALLRKTGRNV